MNDLEAAIELAVQAHAGQTDKAGATYVRHPLRVMRAVETDTARVVAVLHDVVEDADVDLADIERQFGPEVRAAVDALTKRDDESYMEFVERAGAHPVARRVKLADIEDNMDLTRLDDLDEPALERQAKYHEAWQYLQDVASGGTGR